MPGFRVNSQELSVTWPRCDIAKEAMLRHVQLIWQDTSYICVSRELHADGHPHLHGHIQFKKRKDIINETILNYGQHHPNIQKVKYTMEWNTYVKKDGDFVESGQFVDLKPHTRSKKKQKMTNKELLEENPLDLVDKERISLLALQGLISARELYFSLKVDASKLELPTELDNPWGISMPLDKSVKKRHYWLWSTGPNFGKTTWMKGLTKTYRAEFRGSEIYQNFNRGTQLLLVDGNFKVEYKILESMCDGNYKYPVKKSTAVQLDEPFIIVCTNRNIDSVYPNVSAIVHARFNEFNLADYISPFI